MDFNKDENTGQTENNKSQEAFTKLRNEIQRLEQDLDENIELYKGHLGYLFRSIIYQSLNVEQISEALRLTQPQKKELQNYILESEIKIDPKSGKITTEQGKNFSFSSYDDTANFRDLINILQGEISIILSNNDDNTTSKIRINHETAQFSSFGEIFQFDFEENKETSIAQDYLEFFKFYMLCSLIRYKLFLGQIPDLDKNPNPTRNTLKKFEFFVNYLNEMKSYLENLVQEKYTDEPDKQYILIDLITRINDVITMSKKFQKILKTN